MREIKFRGKRIDNGQWIHGDCLHFNNGIVIVPHINVDEIDIEKLEVVPSTLGQYTGLEDKNGKEIYKGDIVKYKSELKQWDDILIHEQVGEIKINRGMTGFKGKTKQTWGEGVNIYESQFLLLSAKIYEVIGNIHDNPELLEVR